MIEYLIVLGLVISAIADLFVPILLVILGGGLISRLIKRK